MSNKALNAVWDHSRATGTARLVLVVIADEANDQGLLCAYRRSQPHLARKAGVSVRTAQRAIDALESIGELEVLSAGDGRASSDYRVKLPGLAPLDDETRGDNLTPLGRQSDTPGATTVSPPSSPSLPTSPVPTTSAATGAAGQLPGLADPQPVGEPGDYDPMALPWRLVREAYDARVRKPIESRPATAKCVRRLLNAGWSEAQIADALRASPAWTPTSLQVELSRRGRQPAGRTRVRPSMNDPRREGESRVVTREEIREAKRRARQ